MESNFDILGIPENSTRHDVREAFRKLALKHHSDRGGQDEQFKKIKQAYEDLKEGRKYPDTEDERTKKSRVYSGDSGDETRRKNMLLAEELSKDMRNAEEWLAALGRANSGATRLFGSKALGEIEFERKAAGTVLIKGNYMAGRITYDGPILVQGSITSPSWSPDHSTVLRTTRGDFKMVDPLKNKYKIENGSKIIADSGDIVIGNVFGKKDRVPDPGGKVGLYDIREYRTELNAPNGKIVVENAVDTVSINGDTVIVLKSLESDVRLRGREILVYGSKITHDVEIELAKNGTIRFFESFSIQGLSDDCVVRLENGKSIGLHDIKTKKIRDLPKELVPAGGYEKGDTLVGKGFTITYDMLDSLGKKPAGGRGGWSSRLGFGR